jgi:hypothetical protein
MIFRSTDIETIPDDSRWSPPAPSYKLTRGPRATDLAVDSCLGGSPNRGGEVLRSTLAAVEELEVFPPPHMCRVVSISYVDVRFDPTSTPKYQFHKCYTECRWDATGSQARADSLEHDLLSAFGEAMVPDVHLITWNGRTFDLPVIVMRSLLHKIACRWYYESRDVRYRYSTEGHCDLMDFMSDYGASRFIKLGDFCHLCGLPGKTDMSGDKISVLHAESVRDPAGSEARQARTARYCLQDSIQTALGWLRTRHHVGKVTAESHNAALATFRESPVIASAIDINWDLLMV